MSGAGAAAGGVRAQAARAGVLAWAAGLVLVVLIGVPLGGLLGALLDPPVHPLGTPQPLSAVLQQAGLGSLLLTSLALSLVWMSV